MSIEPEDFKFDHLKDSEPPKNNYSYYILSVVLVVTLIGGFFYWNWTHPDTSDCNYSEAGCEGDTRFGQ